MTNRDNTRLEWVHPKLVTAYVRMNEAFLALSFPIFVVEGVRTAERQKVLYAQGRTAPGRVVTYANGVTKKSNHQVKADAYGHAIDVAFVDDPRTPKDETFDPNMPWALLGMMAKTLGLTWGGDWPMRDDGHLELP